MSLASRGTIVLAAGGLFMVDDKTGLWSCTAKGSLRHKDQGMLLSAGDIVTFEKHADNKGAITSMEPRSNYFYRPKIANLDHVVIVQDLSNAPRFTPLLDKYLAFFEGRSVKDVFIAFTKKSLLDEQTAAAAEEIMAGYKKDGYPVFDAESEWQKLKDSLSDGITMFVGQTGAGKSTLANKIEPLFARVSQEVSAGHGRGKHTTTEVRLLPHDRGYIADTPGFSTVDLKLSPGELARSFHDFARLANSCKFTDCLHLSEKGCAVLKAVEEGTISRWRWQNYANMQRTLIGG